MNTQQAHSIFAEKIAQELIGELTGENVDYLAGKVPEEKFIVGQLSPKPDSAEFLTSRTIINAVGINFNIERSAVDKCELVVHLCGNLFYRTFPSYDEQCQALVLEYNKMFGKEYSLLKQFFDDEEVYKQFWDAKKGMPNSNYRVSILNTYRKISLEDYGITVSLKVSDIYDDSLAIGVVDETSKINEQLRFTINKVIENFVINQDDYYAYEIKEKISIYDMKTRETYFYKFHEYKDILIDPVPVNRWANKSIDVTLPGVFSGMMLAIYYPKSSRRIYWTKKIRTILILLSRTVNIVVET